jgi:hypothetical protein
VLRHTFAAHAGDVRDIDLHASEPHELRDARDDQRTRIARPDHLAAQLARIAFAQRTDDAAMIL